MNELKQEHDDTLETQLRAPGDAQWYACGRYYKQGVNNRWFTHVGGYWRATTVNPHELPGKCEVVL